MTKHKTREDWLMAANKLLNDEVFKPQHVTPKKKVRITCGFPGQNARPSKDMTKNYRIGECWSPLASKDGTVEIMISPILDDPIRVLDVLAHEKVHEIVGNEHGHKAPFRALAVAIGLEGKMTATTAGVALTKQLKAISRKLGKYPHAGIDATKREKKKQTTRLIKVVCDETGYTLRTTQKWIDEYGPPISPATGEVMVVEAS